MNYIEILGNKFPQVEAECHGDPTVLSDIVHVSGDPLPSEEEFAQADLEIRQYKKWQEIAAERDRRYYQGIYIEGVDGKKYWFWTDLDTRGKYSMYDIMIRNSGLTHDVVLDNWKTMTGEKTPMTVAQLYKVISAAIANEKVIFNRGEDKKAEMLLLANPDEYDALSGWPICYTDTLA